MNIKPVNICPFGLEFKKNEKVVLWCGGALLVTLLVIYLEFKAHLTIIPTQHSAALHHPICFALIICFSTGQ